MARVTAPRQRKGNAARAGRTGKTPAKARGPASARAPSRAARATHASDDRRRGPLRVAVVGLGVGARHVEAYRAAGAQVAWVVDHDAAKARAAATASPGTRVARSFESVLEDPDVDVVSIASYDQDHFAQALACLKAGKHAFVEKPLCRTDAELRKLQSAWERHQGRVKLGSNLVLRSYGAFRWLKARLDSGEMGTPYAFDAQYLYGRIEKITQGWRAEVKDYSVMHGGGIHMIDLMLWLLGERPTHVTAAGNRIATKGTPFRYDDYMQASLEFPSGTLGTVTANFGCVHRHQHVLRLYGTGGTFLHDDAGTRLHTSRDPGAKPQSLSAEDLRTDKGRIIQDFVAAVRDDLDLRRQTVSFFDGIRVANACDRAARTQSRIQVSTQ